MGCGTRHTAVVEVSLDAIQKLIAGGYLTGKAIVKINGKPRPLIDNIIETICQCATMIQPSTQLLVIKSLLTLTTSGNCQIHGENLRLVLISCYYIYLNTKNFDVQTSGMKIYYSEIT